MSLRLLCTSAAAALHLAACAAEPAPEPVSWRVLVKLTRADADPEAIARQAAATAGTPVRYVAASSEQWHALMLDCPSDAACEQALARLRADTFSYTQVSLDSRRHVNRR